MLAKKKFYKYIIVGAITAIFDFSTFYILYTLVNLSWFYASVLTFFLAVFFNFMLSINFVFNPGLRYNVSKQFKLFVLASSLAFLINQLSLFILIVYFDIEPLISKLISLGLLTVFNYNVRVRKIF